MKDRELLAQLADPIQRAKLLKNPSRDVIYLIRNIASNLVHSKINLSQEDKKKLVKYKSLIRKLASPKLNKKEIKIYVKHSGNFLSFLAPILYQIALYGAGQLFKKAIGV